MRWVPLILAVFLLAACEARFERQDAEVAAVSICQPLMFEDTPFTHCIAEPGKQTVRTALSRPGGPPYRSLRKLSRAMGPETKVAMAMNAGMYDEDGQPIGYYVENGERLHPLNQADGPGNFHLLPNGIFFGRTAGPWRVYSTRRFAAEVDKRPDFATQSGPMLVIDGELHPAFDPDGESRKIRNAVGVDAGGRAHFLLSEAPVSFGKMARLYRDVLRVDNALFLDGSVSQMWDPAKGRMDSGPQIGPMLVVTNRKDAR
ncbi:phosphodiester glycosidase family protein [Aurantiacibacter spongiae]|uniref:phosphodiester glycosidase family protein n=1 Tax=Aurantiacibacter spongiae TaxID=2488860 RepID=UPI001F3D53D9|nr:phosphodiester glycosidase family protein [Aurantiacibacter spongiae]